MLASSGVKSLQEEKESGALGDAGNSEGAGSEGMKLGGEAKGNGGSGSALLFTERYAPKNLEGIAGNRDAVERIKRWALSWSRGEKQKPLLITGPTGVGKTAVAFAVAEEFGWELIEMNASDMRNSKNIGSVLGAASGTMSLFGSRRLVLVDEVDEMQGRVDRGGSAAIGKIVKEDKHPTMLTARDLWSKKLSGIRSDCEKVEMKKVASSGILNVLRMISNEEGLGMEDVALGAIASSAGGDVRSAVNDLHAKNKSVRDREMNVFDNLRAMFKAETYADARKASFDVDVDHDTFKLWIDENIPNEFSENDVLAKAYDRFSRADVFDGRIRIRQYWGFLRYSSDLMTAGVSLSRKGKGEHFVKYAFPSYLRRMGMSKNSRAKRKSVGRKIGEVCHCSSRGAQVFFPVVKQMFKKSPNEVKELFELDDAELSFLVGVSEKKIGEMLK